MARPCLCRASCLDANAGVSDLAQFIAEKPMRRGAKANEPNGGGCNWPFCYRGDRHPALEHEPVEWR